jgi:hypothetical protein
MLYFLPSAKWNVRNFSACQLLQMSVFLSLIGTVVVLCSMQCCRSEIIFWDPALSLISDPEIGIRHAFKKQIKDAQS